MDRIESNKRFIKNIELLKTILLGLLVISLIALVVVYIGGTKVYESAVADDDLGDSFDKLWSVIGGVEPKGLDPDRLIPDFIGFKQSANPVSFGCVGDSGMGAELYSIIKPCILELFGSSSVCRELHPYEGKKLFDAAARSDEFVYLRYHEPVLYQLIYAYAADKLTVSQLDVAGGSEGNVGAYISEVMIIPDKDFAAHRFVAYASDADGNYYEFRHGDHVVASEFYISKLADRAGEAVSELRFVEDRDFAGAMPIIDKEFECDIIDCMPVDAETENIRDGLLRLFGYNPDKLDGFADGDMGTYVYIDSHSRLKLGKGVVSFLTSDAYDTGDDDLRGIGFDTLLGYSIDGVPTLFDKLTAVDNLISRLYDISPELVGGDGQLCLGDVYSDGALLVIEYILTYDNIRVGEDAYLRAVLTENTVCELELFPTLVKMTEKTELLPKPAYVFGKLGAVGGTGGKPIGTVYLRYLGGKAEWAADIIE